MRKILAWSRILLLSLSLTVFVGTGLLLDFIFSFSPQGKFKIRSTFCKFGMGILGIKTVCTGQKEIGQGPSLFLCNHRSLLDPLICAAFIPAYFLSKAEVEDYPVLGRGSALTGTIFVQRQDKGSRKESRKAIAEAMEKGYNVLLFPEGTTNGEHYTKQFYLGSFQIAQELQVPVVPVMLEYKERKDYWISGGLLAKSVEQFSKWKTHVHLWIGDPFVPKDAQEAMEQTRLLIDQKIYEAQSAWGNEITPLPQTQSKLN